ncbi:MAG: hypothetical protein RBU21_06380 [FCB group bacterium]|nr:hypothetical protein [FCB group bacterium]
MKKHLAAITTTKPALANEYVGTLKSELAQVVDALEGVLEKLDA